MTQDPTKPMEIYANALQFNLRATDAHLDFGLQSPDNPTPAPLVRVHLSIPNAWILAKLIDRVFAQYIQEGNRFTIPEPVLSELGLLEEYREDLLQS